MIYFQLKSTKNIIIKIRKNSKFKLTLFAKQDDNGTCEHWFKIANFSDMPLTIQDVVSLSVPMNVNV